MLVSNSVELHADAGCQRWIDQRKMAVKILRRQKRPLRTTGRLRWAKTISKTRVEETVVGTSNVFTLAYKGAKGIGHISTTVLNVCGKSKCDVVGVQETRRVDKGAFTH